MKYDPILIKRNGDYIEYYFLRNGRQDWFYEFNAKYDSREIWDEHLSKKMWYTPEVRKETLNLMEDILKK